VLCSLPSFALLRACDKRKLHSFFLIIVMARVKSTAWYVGSAAAGGSGSEGRESGGL
jgi:hypothetical protein